MRSRVRVTGCRPPTAWPRPGSVTSIAPAASSRDRVAASSAARRASSAASMRCLAALMAAPAPRRSSAASWPSHLSRSVSSPFLPSTATRTASSAARCALEPMSARVCATSDSRSFTRPAPPLIRGQCGFRFLGDGAERGDIVHRQVREGLAVDLDPGRRQPGDEPAVRQAEAAGGRVDALNPQRTVVALLQAAPDVRILAGLDDGLLGDAEYLAAGVVVALRLLEDFLVPASCNDATLYSCHVTSLLFDGRQTWGSSRTRRPTSVSWTIVEPRSWRLRFLVILVRMWRRLAWPRLKPFAVLRKRFAAARLVFNLGIVFSCFDLFTPLARAGGVSAVTRRSLLLGRDHHGDLASFHRSMLFDRAVVGEIDHQSVEEFPPDLRVGHLPAAEPHGYLGLVTVGQEPDQITQLDLVIRRLRARPEFHFLELDLFLFPLRRVSLLVLLEQELSEVHDPADGRLGGRRNFNEIQFFGHSFREGFAATQDADLASVGANHA